MGRFVSGDNVIDAGNAAPVVSFADVLNKPTTLGGYGITDGAVANNISFNSLVNKPTTLSGFGISDGVTTTAMNSALASVVAGAVTSLPFSSITDKPTTLAGYGITDAGSVTSLPFSSITDKPTTLAGYGITDAGSVSTIPFSSITAVPTTLAGHGITDGVTTTALDTAIAAGGSIANAYVKKSGGDALTGDYSIAGNLTLTGNVVASGDITAYSDERFKTNWKSFSLDFVTQLAEVKSGIYDRTDCELTQVGVSAQSLQNLMPNAVLTDEEGKLSVAYGNAALVAAIELAKEVVALKKIIADLVAKVNQGS